MGTDQQFCLRWNNFHTSITSAFESLRDDEDFVDITLACDGKHIKAHKMVLSACSPYFRNLLKGNPCQHPIVFLKDVTFSNLTSILDFMYHGEVNVSHNDLATFLKTAEALKVRGLAEDDKKKDAENYIEASSPGPPRDPPDPGSPKQDETSATDTHLSDSSPPPSKRHRRRSGTSVQSAEDTSETVLSDLRETSVKNEPQEFNDEDEMLGHSLDGNGDIKNDNMSSEVNDDRNFGPSESVSISRSQAAMQQLQESFGSFLPSMSQSSGYIPHGANDMARPSFPLDGVQGIPPGISTLPGPSMSQASVGQDGSQGESCDKDKPLNCTFCQKIFSSRYNLKKHIRDIHLNKGTKFTCDLCQRNYSSLNSLQVHRSVTHPTGNKRRYNAPSSRRRSSTKTSSEDTGEESQEGLDQEQNNRLAAEVKEEFPAVKEEFTSPNGVESSPQTQASSIESHNALVPPLAHTPLHSQHHQYPIQNRISSPPLAHIPILGLSQNILPAHAHLARGTIPPPQAHTPLPLHMVVFSHDHTPLSPQLHQTPVSPQIQQTSVSPQVMSPQLHQTPMSPQVMSPQMHPSISPQMHPPPSPAQMENISKSYDLHSLSMRQTHHHLGGVIHHQMHHSGVSQQMNNPYNMQVQHAFASSPVNEASYHSIDHSMNLQ